MGGLCSWPWNSWGSSGTPGVLGEALRGGTGPAGFIVTKADINLAAGAMVAAALYGIVCPVILVDGHDFSRLPNALNATLGRNGTIVTR